MVNALLNLFLVISATNKTVLPVACKVHIDKSEASARIDRSLAINKAMQCKTGIAGDRPSSVSHVMAF